MAFDLDDYDDNRYCPDCGEPMTMDTDGDGVMTMSYDVCENCGVKDPGEPVRLFEQHILPQILAEREKADERPSQISQDAIRPPLHE